MFVGNTERRKVKRIELSVEILNVGNAGGHDAKVECGYYESPEDNVGW